MINENKADTKQIQRDQVKLVYDLSLRHFSVLQQTAIVTVQVF